MPSILIAAPLAGISDTSYRMICRRHGADFTFVEMINVRALSHKNKKTRKMLSLNPDDRPIGVQILGCELPYILKALDTLEEFDFDLLDFNAACPVRKVCRRGEGAALMQDPRKLENLLRPVRRRWTKTPFTIKIRSGWDETSINAAHIAQIAQDAGLDAVFIHGRTREQFYTGSVNHAVIKEIKEKISLPVFGSGDILSAEGARTMLEQTGCDGLLVARGALGSPWIFSQIKNMLTAHTHLPPPPLKEIIAILRAHLDLSIAEHGEKKSIPLMRKFVGWYLKRQPHSRAIRQHISGIKTLRDFETVVHRAGQLAE
jgi:tRNA-dihydrouridine synthase B